MYASEPVLQCTIRYGVGVEGGKNEGNILHKHQRQVRQNIVRKIKAPKPTPTQYCTFRSGIAVGDSKYLEILTNLCMILYEENSDGMVLESVFVLYLIEMAKTNSPRPGIEPGPST